MTFLQPFILWGLPLILIPVVIHFLNRMRHRPQPWAAMRFLISATRSSVSHAKLRQWLVLALRVLAVLTLVLFLARPLAGGWLGWMLSPSPDVILLLLDRSASMETRLPGGGLSRREQALKLLTQAAREYEDASHLVLIENVLRTPQEIANAAALAGLELTAATDTAADLPSLLQSALTWLVENRAGTAEIWIASDLQRGNWRPDDARWKDLMAQYEALPQKVRVRLLALGQEKEPNTSLLIREVARRQGGNGAELQFVVDVQRNTTEAATIPIVLNLDGARSQIEVPVEGQNLRWRHQISLGTRTNSGWGSLELPADANARDNTAFFVYGAETPVQASVVASDRQVTPFLRHAAAAFANGNRVPAAVSSPDETANVRWDDKTLILWQAPLPEGAQAERVRAFIEEGGVAVFLPPAQSDGKRFQGLGWGEVQTTEKEKAFHIGRWDQEQGPLAKTDEGLSLPLPQVSFSRRQGIAGARNILAAFDDGAPFLARETIGRGEAYFCASLPAPEWSTLGDGPVLVPMLQRLMQAGARRLQQSASAACGELAPSEQRRQWRALDSAAPKEIRFQAGVYRSGERLLAVNRPALEDEPEVLGVNEAERLFGAVPFQMLSEQRREGQYLQGEVWRMFLFAMLIFLVVEGILILPPVRSAEGARGPAAARAAVLAALLLLACRPSLAHDHSATSHSSQSTTSRPP